MSSHPCCCSGGGSTGCDCPCVTLTLSGWTASCQTGTYNAADEWYNRTDDRPVKTSDTKTPDADPACVWWFPNWPVRGPVENHTDQWYQAPIVVGGKNGITGACDTADIQQQVQLARRTDYPMLYKHGTSSKAVIRVYNYVIRDVSSVPQIQSASYWEFTSDIDFDNLFCNSTDQSAVVWTQTHRPDDDGEEETLVPGTVELKQKDVGDGSACQDAYCRLCDDGTVPTTMTVTISNVADPFANCGAGACAAINGTYILPIRGYVDQCPFYHDVIIANHDCSFIGGPQDLLVTVYPCADYSQPFVTPQFSQPNMYFVDIVSIAAGSYNPNTNYGQCWGANTTNFYYGPKFTGKGMWGDCLSGDISYSEEAPVAFFVFMGCLNTVNWTMRVQANP